MQSGQLRYRGELQTLSVTRSPTGAEVPGAPALFASVSFKIETPRGDEKFSAGRDQSELTHFVICRYVAGVVPTMQLKGLSGPFNGRTFDITKVDESLRHKGELMFECREYRTSATP